jgi:RecJ-like exonuclease
MTGAISSILMTGGSLTSDHVLIVLAEAKEGGFKMSARAPEKLLKIGVNLGAALSEVAPKHSGFGGGHNVAAGAYVKVEDPTTFLKDVDDALASQIANAQPAK